MSKRLTARFAKLKAEGRAGLVAYIMAADPDLETSYAILKAVAAAGADVIELGFPFSDPMADGPAIQKAAERSLKAGGSLRNTLAMVKRFRAEDPDTPLVLMGYANPVEQMGHARFAEQAEASGADGVIVVDLPPEEDRELRQALKSVDISLIRLAAPTTDDRRLPRILEGVSGFLYYVSVTGVTGAQAPAAQNARQAVERLKRATDLPVAVGFGVREPAAAAELAQVADAVVVGSAFVDLVAKAVESGAPSDAPRLVAEKVRSLADAIRGARLKEEVSA